MYQIALDKDDKELYCRCISVWLFERATLIFVKFGNTSACEQMSRVFLNNQFDLD